MKYVHHVASAPLQLLRRHCTRTMCLIQSSTLRNKFYKHQSVVDTIVERMMQCEDVAPALREFQGCATYDAVDHIKVIVKQLTGHTELGLKNEEAGTLTYATTKAMKRICDNVFGVNSKLCERKDKLLGSIYVRTSTVHSDRKYQVVNSTGKHTNAILSCLSWMKQNLTDFVESRREIVLENEKRIFFDAMVISSLAFWQAGNPFLLDGLQKQWRIPHV